MSLRRKILNVGVAFKTARKIGKKGTDSKKCYIFLLKKGVIISSIPFFTDKIIEISEGSDLSYPFFRGEHF